MEGTIRLKDSAVRDRYERELGVLLHFRRTNPAMRKLLSARGLVPNLGNIVKSLKRLKSIEGLSKEFRIVRHDPKVTRKISRSHRELEVPLVFRTKLPAKSTAGFVVKEGQSWPIKVSAKVPYPPMEALAALNAHKAKFDWMELWWIPKSVHVHEVKPDPMIVGTIQIEKELLYHFEIYRWIDESLEDAYWAKEGY